MIDFYRFVTSCIKKTSCESGTENCIRFDFAAVYVGSSAPLPCTTIFCSQQVNKYFKSRLSLIVRVIVVLNYRTVVVDSDWRSNNLCGSHHLSQSECITSVDGIILWLFIWLINYVMMLYIGHLSVKRWCYWLWRLIISNWCISIHLLSQLNSRLLLVKLSVLQSFSRS